jgi:superfamily II RNA helicase
VVQLVALSATLRRPQDFVGWISKARKRPGEIVVRKDRHVPLHFGG